MPKMNYRCENNLSNDMKIMGDPRKRPIPIATFDLQLERTQ